MHFWLVHHGQPCMCLLVKEASTIPGPAYPHLGVSTRVQGREQILFGLNEAKSSLLYLGAKVWVSTQGNERLATLLPNTNVSLCLTKQETERN